MELQEEPPTPPPRRITLQSCLLSEWRIYWRIVGSVDEDLYSVLAGFGFDHCRITMSDVSARCMALPETMNKDRCSVEMVGERMTKERTNIFRVGPVRLEHSWLDLAQSKWASTL
ncbi:hypothetical protein S83_009513 [Arachis hypogaea]